MSIGLPLIFAVFNLYFAYHNFKAKQWGWMGVALAFASYAIYNIAIQLL